MALLEASEVKLVTEFLISRMENKVVTNWVFVNDSDSKEFEGFDEFYKLLPLMIEEISCKGRLIYFSFFDEYVKIYALHNLGRSGKWQNHKDEQCKWYVEINEKDKIWFRGLATLKFTSDEKIYYATINNLGIDILSENFTLSAWRNLLKKYGNKNITCFLMNQNIISGCGNYTKAESLYYAGLSPTRQISSLTEEESDRLFEGLRIIPRLVYNKKMLEIEPKIYAKPHAKKTKTADSRITYWDPNVQK